MVNQLLVTLLNSILGTGTPTARGNYSYFCFKCNHHKRKLEINFDENSQYFQNYHCWNINCNFRGKNLQSLFKEKNISQDKTDELLKLTKNKKIIINKERSKIQVNLPKEFKEFKNSNLAIEKQALNFLVKRNISYEEILKYNIGYCIEGTYQNRIIIPSYDENYNLNYFVARTFEKDNPIKYRNPTFSKDIIPFEFYINWNLPIILVEGVFDALAIKRNVIPLLGGQISNNLMKKLVSAQVKEIYIVLDKDAFNKSIEYCEKLINFNKTIYLVELKGKDPSEEGFLNMMDIIDNTYPLTYYNLIEKKLSQI